MRQIHKALQQCFDDPTRRAVAEAFLYLFKNQPLTTSTFSTSANPYFTLAAQILCLVDGVTTVIPTSLHFTPGGITVPNSGANIAVYGFAVDNQANAYTFGGSQTWSALNQIIWPTPPDANQTCLPIVYAIVTNGSAGNYVPGTTATNTASLSWTFIYEVDGLYEMNGYGQT
jgi:hypothetical protein